MVLPPGVLTGLSILTGFGSAWLQGRNQQQAAAQSNKEQKKINEARYERDIQLDELDYLSKVLAYAQQLSVAEANRYVDDVKRVDYETSQSRVIETALKNLDLNIEALNDRFVTGEQLRYLDESIKFDNVAGEADGLLMRELTALGIESGASKLDFRNTRRTTSSEALLAINRAKTQKNITIANNRRNRKAEIDAAALTYKTGKANVKADFNSRKRTAKNIRNQQIEENNLEGYILATEEAIDYRTKSAQNVNNAKRSNQENMQRVAGYMNSIKERNLQAQRVIAETETEGQNIQESIVIQDSLDTLKRDAESITAILDSATARNSSVVRSGGSNSAEAVAMNRMKSFGRSYGELQLREKDRQRQINGYNSKLKGQVATQMEQIAQAIEGEQQNISYTESLQGVAQAGFNLTEKGLKASRKATIKGIKQTNNLKNLGIAKTYNDTLNQLRTNRSNQFADLLTAKKNRVSTVNAATTGANMIARFNNKYAQKDARLDRKNKTKDSRLENRLTQMGIRQRKGNSMDKFNLAMNTLTQQFNEILVPGFELGNRQGNRELQSQIIGTQNTILANSTPFRPAIIEDPLAPIRGLAPEKIKSTSAFSPSTGSIGFDAFVQGFGSALNTSYTDASGNLRFY